MQLLRISSKFLQIFHRFARSTSRFIPKCDLIFKYTMHVCNKQQNHQDKFLPVYFDTIETNFIDRSLIIPAQVTVSIIFQVLCLSVFLKISVSGIAFGQTQAISNDNSNALNLYNTCTLAFSLRGARNIFFEAGCTRF